MNDQTSVPANAGPTSVVPAVNPSGISDAARDPIKTMVEIAKDPALSPEDKTKLIELAKQRFSNRRRMAYISLWTVVATLAYVGIVSAVDGIAGTTVSTALADNQTLVSFALAFLTALVVAYYGMSTWRPSS